jgi:hypothetical protein
MVRKLRLYRILAALDWPIHPRRENVMSNERTFGSSHAASSPPKKKAEENVRTTPGDPLRDEIRKTPKRVDVPGEPESHGGVDPNHQDDEPQRRRPINKPKDAF